MEATKDFKVICYVKVSNENDNIITVINNIKEFNKKNQSSKIKYVHCKKIYEKDNVQYDHIYFKLNSSKWSEFKEAQKVFSKSNYVNTTEYIANESDIEKIKKIRDSFVNIRFDEDQKIFRFTSRTIEKGHNYLIRKLFVDNKIEYDLKKMKLLNTRHREREVDNSHPRPVEENVEEREETSVPVSLS
jgi:hypothetical protein